LNISLSVEIITLNQKTNCRYGALFLASNTLVSELFAFHTKFSKIIKSNYHLKAPVFLPAIIPSNTRLATEFAAPKQTWRGNKCSSLG
jgi:hypothetical protein